MSWTVKEAPVIKIHSETQLRDCSFSKTNVMHSFCLGSFSSLSHSLRTRVIKQTWCRPIIFTLKAINQDWRRKWRQLSKISYVTRVRLKSNQMGWTETLNVSLKKKLDSCNKCLLQITALLFSYSKSTQAIAYKWSHCWNVKNRTCLVLVE